MVYRKQMLAVLLCASLANSQGAIQLHPDPFGSNMIIARTSWFGHLPNQAKDVYALVVWNRPLVSTTSLRLAEFLPPTVARYVVEFHLREILFLTDGTPPAQIRIRIKAVEGFKAGQPIQAGPWYDVTYAGFGFADYPMVMDRGDYKLESVLPIRYNVAMLIGHVTVRERSAPD